MKKTLLHSVAISLVLALLLETYVYFTYRPPDFFSWKELGDFGIATGALTLLVVPFYLMVLKIRQEKQVMHLAVKLVIGTIALILATIGLYYDDGPDWKKFLGWGIYVGILIHGFIFFIIMSFVFLFAKRRFD